MFTVEIQIFPLATVRLIGNTACFISINVIQRFAQEDVLLTVGTVQDFLYIAIQFRNLVLVKGDVSIYVPGKVSCLYRGCVDSRFETFILYRTDILPCFTVYGNSDFVSFNSFVSVFPK